MSQFVIMSLNVGTMNMALRILNSNSERVRDIVNMQNEYAMKRHAQAWSESESSDSGTSRKGACESSSVSRPAPKRLRRSQRLAIKNKANDQRFESAASKKKSTRQETRALTVIPPRDCGSTDPIMKALKHSAGAQLMRALEHTYNDDEDVYQKRLRSLLPVERRIVETLWNAVQTHGIQRDSLVRKALGVADDGPYSTYDGDGVPIDNATRDMVHTSVYCFNTDLSSGRVKSVSMVYAPGSRFFNVAWGRIVLLTNTRHPRARSWIRHAIRTGQLIRVFLFHSGLGCAMDRGLHRVLKMTQNEEYVLMYRLDRHDYPDVMNPICIDDGTVLYYGLGGNPECRSTKACMFIPPPHVCGVRGYQDNGELVPQTQTTNAEGSSVDSVSDAGVDGAQGDGTQCGSVKLSTEPELTNVVHPAQVQSPRFRDPCADSRSPDAPSSCLYAKRCVRIPEYSQLDPVGVLRLAMLEFSDSEFKSAREALQVFPPGCPNRLGKERFDSRHEMRWSVFFKSLGIQYIREFATFTFDGYRYTPDFYLPAAGLDGSPVWLEIKPCMPTLEALNRCRALSLRGCDVALIFGMPSLPFVHEGSNEEHQVANHGKALYWRRGTGELEPGFAVFSFKHEDSGNSAVRLDQVFSNPEHVEWSHECIKRAVDVAYHVVPHVPSRSCVV